MKFLTLVTLTLVLFREWYTTHGLGPSFLICMIVFNLLVKALMIAVGYHDRDRCPNGAANWLFVGGILLFVANLVIGLTQLTKIYAWSHSRESERLMLVMFVLAGAMTILEFSVIIWGSVLVFSVWEEWHDKWGSSRLGREAEAKFTVEDDDYCPSTSMVFAFIVLICHWAFILLIILAIIFIGVYICCCGRRKETNNN